VFAVLQNPKVAVSVTFVAAMFMSILDTTIVNTALPTIARELDASLSTTGVVATGYLVAVAVVIPASGWLGDRFGDRRVFLIALALFAGASALCGIASTLGQLVVFRVLQGIGGGMLVPVGMTLMFRTFPQAERVRVSRLIMIPTAMAPALGPVLGGLITDHLAWEWVFLVNVPIGLAALLFGLRFLPRDAPVDAGRFDAPGLVLAGVGLGALMYAVSEGPSRGWGSPEIVGFGSAGLVLLAAFVAWELRSPHPMLDLRLLRTPIFRRSILVMVPATAGFLGLLYAFPQLQQEALGRTPTTSGLLTFPEAIGVMLGSQVVARLYPIVGPRRVMLAGASGVGTMALALTLVDAETSNVQVVATMLVFGFSMSAVFLPVQSAGFAQTSAAETGQASALFNALRQASAAAGVATLATVIAVVGPGVPTGAPGGTGDLDPYHAAFVATAVLMALAAVLSFWIRDEDAASTMVRDRH
jgi:EmrB/QacA subfamily drug resistance transporter